MAARSKVYVDVTTTTEKSNKGLAKYAVAAGVAAVAIAGLIKIGKDLVDAYEVQEQAEAKLTAALKTTGEYSESTANELKNYASELQGVTTFGDEATISAMALLQQLADLDKDGLKAVIPGMQDFAAAMGVDMQTAASLIGKTLGSTTNALQRYGIEIDTSGTKEEKLVQITQALNDKFGGTAKAVADTATGSMVQMQNALGDLNEAMGKSIASGLQPFAEATTSIVTSLAEWINKNTEVNELLDDLSKGADTSDTSLKSLNESLQMLENKKLRQSRDGVSPQVTADIAAVEELIANYDNVQGRIGRVADSQKMYADNLISRLAMEKELTKANTAAQTELEKMKFESLSTDEKKLISLQSEIDGLVILKRSAISAGTDWNAIEELLVSNIKEKNDILSKTPEITEKNSTAIVKAGEDYLSVQEKEKAGIIAVDDAEILALKGHLNRAKAKLDLDLSNNTITVDAYLEGIAVIEEASLTAEEKEAKAAEELKLFYEDLAENGLGAFASAFKMVGEEGVKGWDIFKQAGKDAISAILESLARVAITQAGIQAAEGMAALAGVVTAPLAPGHFAAAAGYTTAAAAAYAASGAVQAFGNGGDFTTNGPEMIMVGESGKERVRIDPQPDSRGSGGDIYINVGDVYGAGGKDEFIEDIVNGISRVQRTRTL